MINPLNASEIETSQLICTENHLTGFYMKATLAFNGLKKHFISNDTQQDLFDVLFFAVFSLCYINN